MPKTPAEIDQDAREDLARTKREGGVGFAPFVLAAVALIFLVLGVLFLRKAEESESWPSTTGEILESKVEESTFSTTSTSTSPGNANAGRTGVSTGGGTVYGASVSYEYEVGGERLLGNRLSFAQVHSSDPAAAKADVARYPAGRAVEVFYDPNDPTRAVLERTGARLQAMLAFLATGVLIAMAILFALVAIRNQRAALTAVMRSAAIEAVIAALQHAGEDHRWYRRQRDQLIIEDAMKAALVARTLRQWAPDDLEDAREYFEAVVAPEHRALFNETTG